MPAIICVPLFASREDPTRAFIVRTRFSPGVGTARSRLFVSRPVTFPVVGTTESSFQTIGTNHLTFDGELGRFLSDKNFFLTDQ